MKKQLTPCNNCKKSHYCEFVKLAKKLPDGFDVWEFSQKVHILSWDVGVVSADNKEASIEVECVLFTPKKKQASYEGLLNSKPPEQEFNLFKPPSKCGGGCKGCK